MRLTHLGHACLLVEAAGARVLLDPGSYSADFTEYTGLDAVLITHQHADHADPERLPALLAGNPDAVVLAEPETITALGTCFGRAEPTSYSAGARSTVRGLRVEGVGDRHAFNHDGVPRCGNTGFVLSAPGEPTLFHPGDAYDATPPGEVDVLALPLNAPWTPVRDTLDFANRIGARWLVPIHDALLSPAGRDSYLMHVDRFTGDDQQTRDLANGGTWTVT